MTGWDGEVGRGDEIKAPTFLPFALTPRLCLLLGAIIGLTAYALTFPLDAVFAGADAFGFEPDQQQHITAIRYFAWDDWRWPLFLAQPMGAPEGSNIVFSDGLPLYSLLVRFLRDILFWPDSNVLALWLALCYALQGLAAVAALLLAGMRHGGVLLLGAVFALALPSFILRFSHTPLCTQGLILLALGLYLRGRRQPEQADAMLLWGVLLCWGTLLINAYLFVMVSAVFGALWLSASVDRAVTPLRSLLMIGAHLGGSLLLLWSGGFLAAQGAGSGFGRYSWNPLSLFVPQQSTFFPDWPMVDATGGQYEGFSYLGLGLILALIATAVAARHRLPAILRRHWALLLAVAALLLLALSNRIWLGQWQLLDLGEAPAFLGALRSSGRMVWVLVYLLLLAVLLTLPRAWGRGGLALLAFCTALQLLDSQSYRDNLSQRFADAPAPAFPSDAWGPLMAGKDLVEVMPDFVCGREDRERALVNLVVYQASGQLVPASTAYSARPAPRNCSERPAAAVFFRELPPDRLLVLVGRQDNLIKLAVSSVGIRQAQDYCRLFRAGIACSRTWPDLPAVNHYFKTIKAEATQIFPAVRVGGVFKPSMKGETAALLGPGWGENQAGAWTLNGVGYLILRPDRLPPNGLQLTIEALLPALPGAQEQDLWITVNGKELGRWSQVPGDSTFRAALRFASSNATDDGLLLIGLHNAHPVAAPNRPTGSSVTLGLRVDSFTLTALP